MAGDSNHQSLGWNAHRHQSSPIGQPRYRFRDVPRCKKDLEGSVVQEVSDARNSFKVIMAEMVLLCTEAVKRNRCGRTAGKPLSLEYIADRLDVDDPCFGYVVRSEQGHLQGFITVTTFTNWKKKFSWDSLKEMSFYYDCDSDDGPPAKKKHRRNNGKAGGDPGGDPGDSPPPAPPRDEPQSTPSSSQSSVGEASPDGDKKPAAFRTPIHHNRKLRAKTKRIIDEDGSLAKELEKTVRLGNPDEEGIIWPRIAEISLLGALGCGSALVRLVIEQLEFQRATGAANYDYIALQATDNSIPFYERVGFVRVGAVCYDTAKDNSSGDADSRPSSPGVAMAASTGTGESGPEGQSSSSGNKTGRLVMPEEIVASPNFVHEIKRPGESPNDIAKRFKICVWDIIFLNKDVYLDLKPTSRLMKGTQLYVPENLDDDDDDEKEESQEGTPEAGASSKKKAARRRSGASLAETPTKWFVAKENDTPKKIASKFGVACKKLVTGNLRRLPELTATSRLRAGTRVKVSNLDQQDTICEAYCHWSFPDDTAVESGDPSYMMVYKLDRKTARNKRTVRDSLVVPVTKHSPPRLLFDPPPKHDAKPRAVAAAAAAVDPTAGALQLRKPSSRSAKAAMEKLRLRFGKKPTRPEELSKSPPQSGEDVYWEHQKELHPEFRQSTPESERIIQGRWSRLGTHKKNRYHVVAAEARTLYNREEQKYEGLLSKWKKECDRIREEHQQEIERKEAEAAVNNKENTLFSKVVKIRDDALEGKEYKYWFVLTYIPDLKWCHLAPMVQEGHFGPDRKRSHGRPRYRLVDEKLGMELDISSMFCIAVKSKALKKTADADKEEWDIIDGAVKLVKQDLPASTTPSTAPRADGSNHATSTTASAIGTTRKTLSKQPKFRSRTPAKPPGGKIAIGSSPRKHSQDPFSRTRGSPNGRKRRLEEIRHTQHAKAIKMASTASTGRKRQPRRCMRCVEHGATETQAQECLGAKGRFGKKACEYYDDRGARRKAERASPEQGGEANSVGEAAMGEANPSKTTIAPSTPKPSRRPDASSPRTPVPSVRPEWSSPSGDPAANGTRAGPVESSGDANQNALNHTPHKSPRPE